MPSRRAKAARSAGSRSRVPRGARNWGIARQVYRRGAPPGRPAAAMPHAAWSERPMRHATVRTTGRAEPRAAAVACRPARRRRGRRQPSCATPAAMATPGATASTSCPADAAHRPPRCCTGWLAITIGRDIWTLARLDRAGAEPTSCATCGNGSATALRFIPRYVRASWRAWRAGGDRLPRQRLRGGRAARRRRLISPGRAGPCRRP